MWRRPATRAGQLFHCEVRRADVAVLHPLQVIDDVQSFTCVDGARSRDRKTAVRDGRGRAFSGVIDNHCVRPFVPRHREVDDVLREAQSRLHSPHSSLVHKAICSLELEYLERVKELENGRHRPVGSEQITRLADRGIFLYVEIWLLGLLVRFVFIDSCTRMLPINPEPAHVFTFLYFIMLLIFLK